MASLTYDQLSPDQKSQVDWYKANVLDAQGKIIGSKNSGGAAGQLYAQLKGGLTADDFEQSPAPDTTPSAPPPPAAPAAAPSPDATPATAPDTSGNPGAGDSGGGDGTASVAPSAPSLQPLVQMATASTQIPATNEAWGQGIETALDTTRQRFVPASSVALSSLAARRGGLY